MSLGNLGPVSLGMVLESGWRECDLSDCDYITIPGTPLRLPIQRGFAEVMQAFLRDLHENVESCMNARGIADEGSWTENNSVYTSNHKGAVAVDWNWEDHPMGPDAIAGDCRAGWCGSDIIKGNQVPAVLELLQWYTFEGLAMIKWGATWTSPKDSMHFQAGYGTAQDPDKVRRFIETHIRADGYSTYRRGGVPRGGGVAVPPTVSSGLTPAVLATIMDHRVSDKRYAQLHPHFIAALGLAECTTVDRRAMFVAQLGHESGGLRYQEEIASGAAYEGRRDLGNTQPGDGVRFKGRDFIQITGRNHYTKLSQWAASIGQVSSPTWFVDHPETLATDEFAFLGVVWYWTVARNMNAFADARDLEGATRAVNGGLNGLDDRRAFYNRALAAGTDLLDPTDLVDPDSWEGLMASDTAYSSRSIYRTSNDAAMRPIDALFGADATSHMNWVEQAALRGEVWAIDLVAATASGTGAGSTLWSDPSKVDSWAVNKARGVLNLIEATNPAALKNYLGK